MKNSTILKWAIVCSLVLTGLCLFLLMGKGDPITRISLGIDGSSNQRVNEETKGENQLSNSSPALFVVKDTTTDSPGTNLETRIVTFAAEVGGTPPIFRQWKVDKGSGFVAVSASATNSQLIIGNAAVADTGLYALFATNRAGSTNTTPVPLIVVEGVD